jgi:hypothetical protein
MWMQLVEVQSETVVRIDDRRLTVDEGREAGAALSRSTIDHQ